MAGYLTFWRMTMFETVKYERVIRSGRHGYAAAIIAAAMLGAPLIGHAQMAEKGMKPMGSMEMHQSMMKGMKDMESMAATGDTDHDFAMMMKKHHQSALDMANVELRQGKDPAMRAMAKRIIDSQTKEIKEFDQWLAKHKPMAPMSKSK